jgi:hypothetical protein
VRGRKKLEDKMEVRQQGLSGGRQVVLIGVRGNRKVGDIWWTEKCVKGKNEKTSQREF